MRGTRVRRLAVVVSAMFALLALTGAARRRSVVVAPPPSGPTFSQEVVRIFQQHCQTCHRPGDIAPFSLVTYQEAKPWAQLIKIMTRTREMPPWKPSAGCGEFAGERVLTAGEIETIGRWVDDGAPEGNPADLPTPLDFSGGWSRGEPDVVLKSPEPYTPPSRGDVYRCFTMPTNTTSERYVAAVDFRPGDRETVHHVIAFIDTTGASAQLDAADPGPGYGCFGGPGFSFSSADASTLGGWAPGSRPIELPPEVAFSLPASSRIVLQVHYHASDGRPDPDQTEIALYYAKQKPQKLLRVLPLINQSFTIPPNHPNYAVRASFTTPLAVHLWLVAPHMHLLGRTMKVEATLPGGSKQCLVQIDDWDFNWQGMYRYRQPIPIPALTRLELTATYDNSSNNPLNPNNPPKPVSWGEATTDEMCIAFVGFTLDYENLADR